MARKHKNMIANCKIFAALHEDTDKGWIWLSLGDAFVSRMTIKILKGKESVYCEYRKIDDNFVNMYNRCEHRKSIGGQKWQDVIVISDWYRKAWVISGQTKLISLWLFTNPMCLYGLI